MCALWMCTLGCCAAEWYAQSWTRPQPELVGSRIAACRMVVLALLDSQLRNSVCQLQHTDRSLLGATFPAASIWEEPFMNEYTCLRP